MDNLWIYGCSHSAGNLLGYHHSSDKNKLMLNDGICFIETTYTQWLNRIGKPFFVSLGESLNMNWVLRAEAGNSNQQQFKKLLADLDKIKQNDIVIFGLTHFQRFEVPKKQNGKWISDGWQRGNDEHIKESDYQHYYLTQLAFSDWFIIENVKQILLLLNYIESKIGAKVFIWSFDNIDETLDEYTNLSTYKNLVRFEIDGETHTHLSAVTNFIDRNEQLCIKGECGGIIEDTHFGEIGHKFMYENILKLLKK
jgi:hypothetical protein